MLALAFSFTQLFSCYFSILLSFLHIFIHSLHFHNFSIHWFTYPFIFLIFIKKVKANTVNVHTYTYTLIEMWLQKEWLVIVPTPMNKNKSARNYIQFSSCDSLQNRETNFTKWAGKGGVINLMSAHIQAVTTLSSRYANFSKSTEGTTTWNTISGMIRTLRDHWSISISTSIFYQNHRFCSLD